MAKKLEIFPLQRASSSAVSILIAIALFILLSTPEPEALTNRLRELARR